MHKKRETSKIHNLGKQNCTLKISFFTKFTFSKSHFSQNSHFQKLIFHKIHIFKHQILTNFRMKIWFLPQCVYRVSHQKMSTKNNECALQQRDILDMPHWSVSLFWLTYIMCSSSNLIFWLWLNGLKKLSHICIVVLCASL